MDKKYLVFVIQAYDSRSDDGKLWDVVELQLIALTYEQAEARAKGIIKKQFYRLSTVIEKYHE